MTKAELVSKISHKTGIDKEDVQVVAEQFMIEIKKSIVGRENVYLRGFGTFGIKKRAQKVGRNITKNVSIIIPEHYIPFFKPSKSFTEELKSK